MSAAEKLRELLEDVARNDQANLRVGHALLTALPELIAVVEAAEAEDLFELFDDSIAYPLQKQLAQALEALNTKLGEK